jgi:phosphotransferase system  glucose/maltose/N-acetylglucosamine-specific IIC component
VTSLRLLVVGLLAAMAAYGDALRAGAATTASGWLMAVALVLILPATLALGARRSRGTSRLAMAVAVLLGLVLAAGFGLALGLPDLGSDEPLWLGLPRRAAVMVYGVGLIPLLFLPWAYARTHAGTDLDAATVADLADRCASLQREHGIRRVDAE